MTRLLARAHKILFMRSHPVRYGNHQTPPYLWAGIKLDDLLEHNPSMRILHYLKKANVARGPRQNWNTHIVNLL